MWIVRVCHNCSRTTARAAENVGSCLLYQATCRMGNWPRMTDWSASRDTRENRPSRAGVVRTIQVWPLPLRLHAQVIPHFRVRHHLHLAAPFAIPILDRNRLPHGLLVLQHLLKCGQTGSLLARLALLPRLALWRRLVQCGIQPQTCHHAEGVVQPLHARQQLDHDKAAVSD